MCGGGHRRQEQRRQPAAQAAPGAKDQPAADRLCEEGDLSRAPAALGTRTLALTLTCTLALTLTLTLAPTLARTQVPTDSREALAKARGEMASAVASAAAHGMDVGMHTSAALRRPRTWVGSWAGACA